MNTTVGERDVKQLRSLEVNVVEAHSSNKVSHPYCMISLNEVKTCRTKTQEGHSPIWNEEFKFKWVNWFWIWQHTFTFLCSSVTVEPLHNGHLVERFKQESMCGLSAKKVAVEKKWPLAEVRLYYTRSICFWLHSLSSFTFPAANYIFDDYTFPPTSTRNIERASYGCSCLVQPFLIAKDKRCAKFLNQSLGLTLPSRLHKSFPSYL